MKRYIVDTTVYGMTKILPTESNLDYEIWLDPTGVGRNTKHNKPRLKVLVDGNRIPVSISKNPRILINKEFKGSGRVLKWISENFDILMRHWNQTIGDKEVLTYIKPLK